jgi:hypothetical protein
MKQPHHVELGFELALALTQSRLDSLDCGHLNEGDHHSAELPIPSRAIRIKAHREYSSVAASDFALDGSGPGQHAAYVLLERVVLEIMRKVADGAAQIASLKVKDLGG